MLENEEINPTLRSEPVLTEFVQYCKNHPHQRFWQALRNFSNFPYIFAANQAGDCQDTYYWEGKE